MDALATTLPTGAVPTALQRQASERVTSVPARPQTAGDWVTIMRHQAEQVQGSRMNAKATQAFTTLQRQVTGALVQSVKRDPRPAIQRHAEFAQHAVALQRHTLTNHIPRAALAQLPPGERLSLQRAVDDAVHADALQRQQDEQALKLHSLQRQLAELDEQATKPVMDRIQARRGSGNPLPTAVRRHLEQGLNHDLSAVRIHDDAEADKLAKGVNATAFTTGTDIYFRSGKFNPNTQTGLELLAHEVTHTVQQSQGKVGKGIDPDSGLEAEARAMGRRLAVPANSAARRGGNLKVRSAVSTSSKSAPTFQRQKDGSGEHGSQKANARLYVRKQMLYVLADLADRRGYVNAAHHLRHYLGNTGATIQVDVACMLKEIRGFQDFVDNQKKKWVSVASAELSGKPVGSGRDLHLPLNYAIKAYRGWSPDWYYAMGAFGNWITGKANKISEREIKISYKVHVSDMYNWDKEKSTGIVNENIKGTGLKFNFGLDDETLGELHKAGLAKEYKIVGEDLTKAFIFQTGRSGGSQ